MTAAVFEARYNRILRGREQGYEELTDLLGRNGDLGPLVRLGLLRRREENAEFQRYHGYIPTTAGDAHLLYIPDKELILVRPGQSAALMTALKKDPAPKSSFKATYAEPTREQFNAALHMREQAGRDVWRVQRAEQLHQHLLAGYMDVRAFAVRSGVGDGGLVRAGLCSARAERAHERALSIELTKEGGKYMMVVDPWELMLVRPGMELPLYLKCDPDKASYWCGLP